ncbi:MAG: phosphoribosylformylglycinamidine synthase subunit PurS [Endomicrobiia bacterium]
MEKYIVEIIPKNKDYKDLINEINTISPVKIHRMNINKIYSFSGVNDSEITFIVETLLVDPFLENYKVKKKKQKKENNDKTIINIWYKPAVLDVVANTISNAVRYLGINKSIEVHSGTQLILEPAIKEKYVKEILEKIFLNPLIQYYEIL